MYARSKGRREGINIAKISIKQAAVSSTYAHLARPYIVCVCVYVHTCVYISVCLHIFLCVYVCAGMPRLWFHK